MKQTLIECANCGTEVEKPTKEINRQRKKGRKHFYCSRKCSSVQNWEHLKEYAGKFSENLVPDNRIDEFTGLREHFRRIKKRSKDVDLDLEHLKQVWDDQNGKCVYTDVCLEHPTSGKSNKRYNYMASLDRIDNSKGYVKGNIQFVSVSINWLKNSMGDEHLKEFFEIVSGAKKDRQV